MPLARTLDTTIFKGGLDFPLYWVIFFAVRLDEGITFKEALLFIPNRVSEDLIFYIQPISFLYFHEGSERQACLHPEIKGAFTESLFLFADHEVFQKKEFHKVPLNDYSLRSASKSNIRSLNSYNTYAILHGRNSTLYLLSTDSFPALETFPASF